MGENLKSAAAALALTLALGLHPQGSDAAEESADAGDAQPPVEQAGNKAPATSPSDGLKAVDAAGVRPVSFVSSLFSTATFILALPFAAFDPAMDVQKTRSNLVDYPYGYTFRRPLGDFDGSAW